MEAQTSVYITSEFFEAIIGSLSNIKLPLLNLLKSLILSRCLSGISNPSGHEWINVPPNIEKALAKLVATLFPSPINVNLISLMLGPHFSEIEIISPIAWHGCSSSLKALITGTSELSENSSIVSCLNVLRITKSLIFDSTLAMSDIFSLPPIPTSLGSKYIGFIPR